MEVLPGQKKNDGAAAVVQRLQAAAVEAGTEPPTETAHTLCTARKRYVPTMRESQPRGRYECRGAVAVAVIVAVALAECPLRECFSQHVAVNNGHIQFSIAGKKMQQTTW